MFQVRWWARDIKNSLIMSPPFRVGRHCFCHGRRSVCFSVRPSVCHTIVSWVVQWVAGLISVWAICSIAFKLQPLLSTVNTKRCSCNHYWPHVNTKRCKCNRYCQQVNTKRCNCNRYVQHVNTKLANATVIVKRFTLSVTADVTVIVNTSTLCVRTETVLSTR